MPKLYFQSQFSMSKINWIFSKKKSFKNINLGDNLKEKHFFLTPIFEPLYFLKSCPIFDELVLPVFSKCNGFLWACQFLDKRPPSLKFHNRTDITDRSWSKWNQYFEKETPQHWNCEFLGAWCLASQRGKWICLKSA